ncbi:MAG: nitroreductase [Myxococcota bacterium]|jgi:nitroreductase
MNVEQAIRTRNSARAFQQRDVDPAIIRRVLDLSMMAPSGCNIQPYRIAVASGGLWKEMSARLVELASAEPNRHELPWSLDYPDRYRGRQRETGFGLYRTLGITRDDRDRRKKQYFENFRGFGAPAAVFVFRDRDVGEYASLDLGIWMQTFMLAAHASGLSTVAQTSLVAYPEVVRRYFDVPEYMSLVCAVSFGYQDESAAVNSYRPSRAGVDEIMLERRENQERPVIG